MKISIRTWALASITAALVAACGGGGGDTTPRLAVSSVQVMGDSLQDAGTFGLKFTVQGAASLIYVERIGLAYGKGPGCNFFSFTGTTFVANPTAGCKNYAVGGAVINGAGAGLAASDPRIVGVQIATATAAGNFAAGDLVVIDGGGNDAATLVGAYLAAAKDGGKSYLALLGTQLSSAQVTAAATGGAAGLATAGGQYMAALADTFYGQVKAGVLDKGSQRVLLINLPPVTDTPRFQMVLDGIAAASGGGTAGATARTQSEAMFRGWVSAFNAELAAKVGADSRVLIFDAAKSIDDVVNSPAQYAVTNVKTPACPITGVGSDGLPTYTFATCTDTALSAQTPPAGASGGANWWHTYYFSDNFHPTPYGHQLAFQAIAKTLADAGWF